jgi:hypothetical protein
LPSPSTDHDFIPRAGDVIELENGTSLVVLATAVASERDLMMAGIASDKPREFFSMATTSTRPACDGINYLIYAHYFSLSELTPKPVRVTRRGFEVWVDKDEEVVM